MTASDGIVAEERSEASGTLPAAITRLLGREGAVGELSSMVWGTRLLSLCGPGGIGKTRLALALAESLREDFVGGAWWVDLSTTFDPSVVAEVVASTRLPDAGVGDPWPAMVEAFVDSTLLVLDNCEQVTDACAELVAGLLARAPGLRVIVTSRQPLHVPGERVWRVPGLERDAIELFVDRAREALGTFSRDAPGAREAIERICRLLDGVPLAIELAAARVPVLGVAQIAERLERSTGVLGRGPSIAPERHQTLQDTLDWSHRLLTEPEQRLLRRLSSFRGTFSLEAAETICCDDALPRDGVLELLGRLVDQSLVQAIGQGGAELRYRLLGPVRQYARQKLDTRRDEAADVRRRHAEYFQKLAGSAGAAAVGPEGQRQLQILESERDNLSEALGWQLEHAPTEAAQLASALWQFWYQRGYYREARGWFEQILAVATGMPARQLAELLVRLGAVVFLQCEYETAEGHLERALELIDEQDDPRTVAIALQRLGSIAREQARYDRSRELHRRSLALWDQLGDVEGVASCKNLLGFVDWLAGEPAAGLALCAEALRDLERAGETAQVASTLVNLGASAMYADELESAAAHLERGLALSRRIGFQEGIAWSLHELAILGRRRRRSVADNVAQLRESLSIHSRLGDRWRMASVLEEIAGAVLARADPRLAVELLAAVDAHRRRLGTPIPPAEQADRDATAARLRGRLGPGSYAAAWAEGAAGELEAVVSRVMVVLDAAADQGDAPSELRLVPTLTGRELDVLRLVSEGHTNAEIAAALYISPSTAGVHVSNILRKLGAKRRVDAAAVAQQLGLLRAA